MSSEKGPVSMQACFLETSERNPGSDQEWKWSFSLGSCLLLSFHVCVVFRDGLGRGEMPSGVSLNLQPPSWSRNKGQWPETEICSEFIKLMKERKKWSQLRHQQWRSLSFSFGKASANNNSQDPRSGAVFQRWHSAPGLHLSLCVQRTKWFILAPVSFRGPWDHTVWLVARSSFPGYGLKGSTLF